MSRINPVCGIRLQIHEQRLGGTARGAPYTMIGKQTGDMNRVACGADGVLAKVLCLGYGRVSSESDKTKRDLNHATYPRYAKHSER